MITQLNADNLLRSFQFFADSGLLRIGSPNPRDHFEPGCTYTVLTDVAKGMWLAEINRDRTFIQAYHHGALAEGEVTKLTPAVPQNPLTPLDHLGIMDFEQSRTEAHNLDQKLEDYSRFIAPLFNRPEGVGATFDGVYVRLNPDPNRKIAVYFNRQHGGLVRHVTLEILPG